MRSHSERRVQGRSYWGGGKSLPYEPENLVYRVLIHCQSCAALYRTKVTKPFTVLLTPL